MEKHKTEQSELDAIMEDLDAKRSKVPTQEHVMR